MEEYSVIAVDLGAESGRVIEICFDGRQLSQNELHRFPNTPVRVQNTLYWDVLRLWHEIQMGIEKAIDRAASIGIDSWGVDFALLDRDGNLVANPVHYRDARTDGMMEWVFERIPRRTVFEHTGVQFMQLNTLYQIASLAKNQSPLLQAAATYLTLPDLFHYWLCGARACEFTHVSTTQFFNPGLGDWDRELLESIGVPTCIFPEIVSPGSRRGEYRGVPVIAPATHDTGSAVVAVPTTTANFAYLSSGTWSLLGLEVSAPVITDTAYAQNVTNEGGVYGTYRLLKNVVGLWLAQQCRATWESEGQTYSYDQLTHEAENAAPFRSLIDPDDPLFLPPGAMPFRIREFCQRTGQPAPQTVGQTMRAIFESLALKYRAVLDGLADLTGKRVETLHVIGGGARNRLLCQMTANSTGREVVAGPFEATALGNGIVQLISLGVLENLAEARRIIGASQEMARYEPQAVGDWKEAFERFCDLTQNRS